MLQLNIEPDVGEAQQSSMSGLPAFLIAGVPQQMAITARDAQGNLTAGVDKVELLLDSVTEGGLTRMVFYTIAARQSRHHAT